MGVSRNPPLSGRSSLGCFPAVSLRALNAPLGPPLFRFPAVTFSKRFEGVWRAPAVTTSAPLGTFRPQWFPAVFPGLSGGPSPNDHVKPTRHLEFASLSGSSSSTRLLRVLSGGCQEELVSGRLLGGFPAVSLRAPKSLFT